MKKHLEFLLFLLPAGALGLCIGGINQAIQSQFYSDKFLFNAIAYAGGGLLVSTFFAIFLMKKLNTDKFILILARNGHLSRIYNYIKITTAMFLAIIFLAFAGYSLQHLIISVILNVFILSSAAMLFKFLLIFLTIAHANEY